MEIYCGCDREIKFTCVLTKLAGRAAFTRSHDDLSIQDRDPYSSVIGLSGRSS